jgi:hypothetical protein
VLHSRSVLIHSPAQLARHLVDRCQRQYAVRCVDERQHLHSGARRPLANADAAGPCAGAHCAGAARQHAVRSSGAQRRRPQSCARLQLGHRGALGHLGCRARDDPPAGDAAGTCQEVSVADENLAASTHAHSSSCSFEINAVSWAHGPHGQTLASISDDYSVRLFRPQPLGQAAAPRSCF